MPEKVTRYLADDGRLFKSDLEARKAEAARKVERLTGLSYVRSERLVDDAGKLVEILSPLVDREPDDDPTKRRYRLRALSVYPHHIGEPGGTFFVIASDEDDDADLYRFQVNRDRLDIQVGAVLEVTGFPVGSIRLKGWGVVVGLVARVVRSIPEEVTR